MNLPQVKKLDDGTTVVQVDLETVDAPLTALPALRIAYLCGYRDAARKAAGDLYEAISADADEIIRGLEDEERTKLAARS